MVRGRSGVCSAIVAAVMAAGLSAHAATLTWDPGTTPAAPSGGTGTWNLSTADWSTTSADVVWSDITATGVDTAVFGGTAGTVTLNTNLSALGLQFLTAGYTISGTGVLTLGDGGITATNSATVGVNVQLAPGNQAWNVASGQTLTFTGTLTRSAGDTLTVQGGAGTLAATALTNTNGILGAWAVVNTGGVYSYATVSGGNVVAYTGAVQETVNTGAWGSIPSGGNGTVNYDITSNGTFAQTGLGRVVNTIRYTGSGATQVSNSSTVTNTLMTTNGIMNTGTGALIIGVTGSPATGYLNITIGASNELVLAAMTSNLTLNNYVQNGAAPGSLTIMGGAGPNNVVTINGASTYTGATAINSGRLVITNSAGLSDSTGTSIQNGGTLDVQGALTNAGIGGLVMTGTGTGGMGALVSSGTGSLGGNVAFSGNTSVGGSGNLTLSGVVSDSGTGSQLTKTGAGALTLSGINTYVGATTITGGSLVLSDPGSINTSKSITLNGSGAALVQNSTTAVSPTVTAINGSISGTGTINSVVVPAAGILGTVGGGSPLNVGTLTLQGAATLNFTVSSTSPSISVSTLSATGSGIVINASNPTWSAGTYDLIGYSSLSGTFADFTEGTIGGLTNRQTASLVNSGSFIALTITGDNPRWTGLGDGTWSVATQSPKNWALISSGTPTDYEAGDTVRFDDTATGTTAVSISAANVSPAQVIFANTNLAYTISGPFGIAGSGSVSLTGGGTVTLNSSNTYTGGTNLTAGTLNINTASAIGTGTLAIAGGTTLDNTSGAPVTLSTNNVQSWAGDFTFNGSNDLNLGTGAVTLAAARTITTNGTANLTVGGAIGDGGNGYGLTKTGPGNLILTGVNTYSGTTIIDQGTLTIAGGVTGTLTTAASSDIQISPNIGDSGTLVVSGGVLNADRVIIGGNTANTAGDNATVTQTGGTINSQQWFTVGSGNGAGASYPAGTYNISAGTLNVFSQALEVADFFGTSGTVNMTGGAINLYSNTPINMGANGLAGNGTFNQSGGTVTFYSDAGVTVGGTGVLSLGKASGLSGAYTYNLNGGTLIVPQITATVGSGGTSAFNFNGGTLKAAAASTNWINNIGQLSVQAGGAIIDDGGFAVTISMPINSGNTYPDGGLTKQGNGTLTLSGSNGYNGPTVVNAGTLLIGSTGTINSSSGIQINGGKFTYAGTGSLSPTVTVNNGTVNGSNVSLGSVVVTSATGNVANGNGDAGILTLNTLTYNSAGTLTVTLSGPSDTTSPGIVVSNLATSGGGATSTGKVTVDAVSSLWNTGTYDLLSYSSYAGPGLSDFVLGAITGLTPRQTASLNTSISGELALTISGGANIIWTGTPTNNDWTTAVLPTKDWAVSSTPTDFEVGDAVVFDDTATGQNVNIGDANVAPTSITFNNSTTNYTISSTGGFGITGTALLVKNGTGSVTLTTANTYSGGTTVNAGSLLLSGAGTIGSGPLTVAGGTLDLGGESITNTLAAVTGGTLNNGTITNNGGAYNVQAGSIGASLAGTNTLSMTGPGIVTLAGANTFTGATTITGGTLNLANQLALQTSDVTLNGGSLTFASAVAANAFTIGALNSTASGPGYDIALQNNANAPIALTIGATNATGSYAGVLSGSGSLIKAGTGTETLSGASTYTGSTTINGGTLSIAADSNLGAAPAAPTADDLVINGSTLLITGSTTLSANRTIGIGPATGATGGSASIAVATGMTVTYGGVIDTAGNTGGAANTFTFYSPNVSTTNGTGTLILTNGNANATYTTTIGSNGGPSGPENGGTLIAAASYALGTGAVTIGAAGNSVTSTLGLQNNATLPNAITLDGRNTTVQSIENFSDSNTLSGTISITSGGGLYAIQSDAGTLTLSGAASAAAGTAITSIATGNRLVTLQGAGNGVISGNIINGSATVALTMIGTGSWTLSGANAFTGGTTISSGTLVAGSALAFGGGALTVHTASEVQLQPGLTSQVKVSSLTLDGSTGAWAGLVDVTNSAMLVTPSDSSTLAAVQSQIQDQVNYGTSSGGTGGIIASALRPGQPFLVMQSGSTSVYVGGDIVGDATGDGVVDLNDLNIVLNHLGTTTDLWTNGNFDGAATIDLNDLNDVLNNLGVSISSGLSGSAISAISTATPEPATLVMLGLAVPMLVQRRKKFVKSR